eukprot:6184148-Pleurochrysis_carterae.AAC.2
MDSTRANHGGASYQAALPTSWLLRYTTVACARGVRSSRQLLSNSPFREASAHKELILLWLLTNAGSAKVMTNMHAWRCTLALGSHIPLGFYFHFLHYDLDRDWRYNDIVALSLPRPIIYKLTFEADKLHSHRMRTCGALAPRSSGSGYSLAHGLRRPLLSAPDRSCPRRCA